MHELDEKAQLSNNFKRREFSCKCGCGFMSPDPKLVQVVQRVREYFDKPVTINSACRCPVHNSDVGGARNSAHLQGIAADISVKEVAPSVVHEFLDSLYPNSFGLGSYSSFTHIDVRKEYARWNG